MKPDAFPTESESTWGPAIQKLARQNLARTHIASFFDARLSDLDRPDVLKYIRKGHAEYRLKFLTEVNTRAFAEIDLEDPEQRASVVQLKLKSLQIIAKTLEAETAPTAAEQERVRRMSTEDLIAEIKRVTNANS